MSLDPPVDQSITQSIEQSTSKSIDAKLQSIQQSIQYVWFMSQFFITTISFSSSFCPLLCWFASSNRDECSQFSPNQSTICIVRSSITHIFVVSCFLLLTSGCIDRYQCRYRSFAMNKNQNFQYTIQSNNWSKPHTPGQTITIFGSFTQALIQSHFSSLLMTYQNSQYYHAVNQTSIKCLMNQTINQTSL